MYAQRRGQQSMIGKSLVMRIVSLSAVAASNVVAKSATPFPLPSLFFGLAEQFVVAFTRYYNYEGTLDVSGVVKVGGTGLLSTATQSLSWGLKGVDPACKDPPLDVENSCGVHIHQGTSCYDDAGPHFWNKSFIKNDPWLAIRYTAKRSFSQEYFFAQASNVEVNTGLTNYNVLGHTLIVHDATGARVACGMIVPKELSVNAFASYIGYEGSLTVKGDIGIAAQGVADSMGQDLKWYLRGVDPACSKQPPAGVANACGIHIHEGTSCYVPAGGHYWNKTAYSEDPWAAVTYKSWRFPFGDFAYDSEELVTTGLDNSVVNGHTMIVHDVTGARVACGILAPQKDVVNAFVPYYTYQGALDVSGMVLVSGRGVMEHASQQLQWFLRGVDPACETVPTGVKNACGVHIHEGMDCTSDALGHYYNQTAIGEDPWLSVTYTTRSFFGMSYASESSVSVVTGLTNFDVLGHTLIVHDSTGARIACGILNVGA